MSFSSCHPIMSCHHVLPSCRSHHVIPSCQSHHVVASCLWGIPKHVFPSCRSHHVVPIMSSHHVIPSCSVEVFRRCNNSLPRAAAAPLGREKTYLKERNRRNMKNRRNGTYGRVRARRRSKNAGKWRPPRAAHGRMGCFGLFLLLRSLEYDDWG